MGSSSPIFGVKIPKIFELPPPSRSCFFHFSQLMQEFCFNKPQTSPHKTWHVYKKRRVRWYSNFIFASINPFTVQLQAICLNWRPHIFYPSRLFCGQELTYCLYFSLCPPPWLDFKGLTKSMFGGGSNMSLKSHKINTDLRLFKPRTD